MNYETSASAGNGFPSLHIPYTASRMFFENLKMDDYNDKGPKKHMDSTNMKNTHITDTTLSCSQMIKTNKIMTTDI
jgi:hypothetical protein